MSPRIFIQRISALIVLSILLVGQIISAQAQTADDPTHPTQTVKLIFIHHSTGENWLRDDHGGLGKALAENNYFVSDTNYGWGPDAIGDRTDIPNWPEWFRGPDSERYLTALYAESEQHAEYTRLPSDPGGENKIIVFKSCFPNSALEGNPGDAPEAGDSLTVSNAKYVYNDLLNYFGAHPDKLFIVITAPPLQDPSLAGNARAFNNWLVNDWLNENNYPYSNVAVFDFYNVLTHSSNHHRWNGEKIEHIINNPRNTSYYPSAPDDDHPNAAGSRKATEEFIPLLNIFYHRWQSTGQPYPGPTQPTSPGAYPAPGTVPTPGPNTAPPVQGDPQGILDNFESPLPVGSSEGWQAWWDEATSTQAACKPAETTAYEGKNALQIDFNIQAGSWATCAMFYDRLQDWSATIGLGMYIHAPQAGLPFEVIAYGGTHEDRESYESSYKTTPAMAAGWDYLVVPWEKLLRVEWEANPGTPFNPAKAAGLAFGFSASEDSAYAGQLQIDDLRLVAMNAPGPRPMPRVEPTKVPEALPPTETPASEAAPAKPEGKDSGGLPCGSALALSAAVALLAIQKHHKSG